MTVINIHTNKLVRLVGKNDNTQRFVRVAMFQGKPRNLSDSVLQQLGMGSVSAAANALKQTEEVCDT